MKTYTARPAEVHRQWLLVDGEGRNLGRVATQISMVLRGKHKPTYTPSIDTGDHVVVVNAGKITLTATAATGGTHLISIPAVSVAASTKLRFEFEVTGQPDVKNGKGAPGRGQLYIDGKLVGQVDIPLTMPLSLGLGGGFVCGADGGSPVWDKYSPPFKFTGKLHGVTVDLSGDLIKHDEMALKAIMMRQ